MGQVYMALTKLFQSLAFLPGPFFPTTPAPTRPLARTKTTRAGVTYGSPVELSFLS